MPLQQKRYSKYIKPISILGHLVILNVILLYFLENSIDLKQALYLNFSWLIISYFAKFYSLHRLLQATKVITRFLGQIIIFTLSYFAYFNVFKENTSSLYHLKILIVLFLSIAMFRLLFIYALKRYRLEGGNFRKVVVVGSNENAKRVINFLNEKSEFGYRIVGYFSNKDTDKENYLGNVDEAFSYISKEGIHELYCSTTELNQDQINEFISFAENNLIILKLIPDSKEVFSKEMVLEYLDYTPVLSIRKLPFDEPIIKLFKRTFDIVFSLIIIIFLLSWLIPILFILVKLDSKGPLFFKQERDGLNGDIFYCYKFRSMNLNKLADKIQAKKEDERVTKTGRFMRKTSIDELPQFFNVLIGDMSVVGPRPHMLSQTQKFSKIVDKYMVRHFVKPGVTGLAQARGYRGEVENKRDMQNRIKLDIYYIENWSFILDLKIIIQTTINLFKGEEKAY